MGAGEGMFVADECAYAMCLSCCFGEGVGWWGHPLRAALRWLASLTLREGDGVRCFVFMVLCWCGPSSRSPAERGKEGTVCFVFCGGGSGIPLRTSLCSFASPFAGRRGVIFGLLLGLLRFFGRCTTLRR